MFPSQTVGPYLTPHFPSISPQAWARELETAFADAADGLASISHDNTAPDFSNTFLALEELWARRERRTRPFFMSAQAHGTEEVDAIVLKWEPRFTAQKTAAFQNEDLLVRCQEAAQKSPKGEWLEPEQRLIDDCLRRFRNAGCGLPADEKAHLLLLEEELAGLSVRFLAACRKASAATVVLESVAAVGLSEEDIVLGKEAARAAGNPNGIGVVLQPDTVLALLKKMEDRYSREALFRACAERGTGVRDESTAQIAEDILYARHRRAELLGFSVASEHLMEETMAHSPDAALRLVSRTWEQLQPALKQDIGSLKVLASDDGIDDLQPWDIPFYAEQWRRQNFDINEDEIRAYLPLAAVRQGAFDVAARVFGVQFSPVDVDWYHPDAHVYEATDTATGESLGLLSIDDAIRPSKGSGAWMDEIRGANGLLEQRPWVVNVCNFPAEKSEAPALLSMEEAVTVFHELGHALHALVTTARYPSQAGTRVAQDFVELPSQILENWVREPEALKTFARHWQTGETIPDSLIEKHQKASRFGESLDLAQYLISAKVDLLLHAGILERGSDLRVFEKKTMAQMGVPSGIVPRHSAPHFSHIFGGDDYAAGYYSYLWAEVLEADAFQRFKSEGLFNQDLGKKLRDSVFAPGGSQDPLALFVSFVGREPDPSALLAKRGLEVQGSSTPKPRK